MHEDIWIWVFWCWFELAAWYQIFWRVLIVWTIFRGHSTSRVLQFSSVQSLSCVRLFATPWITARQVSLSITNSRSLLKLMSIESVMPSSHLILCHPLLLLPPIHIGVIQQAEYLGETKNKNRAKMELCIMEMWDLAPRWASWSGNVPI